jgi:integrase
VGSDDGSPRPNRRHSPVTNRPKEPRHVIPTIKLIRQEITPARLPRQGKNPATDASAYSQDPQVEDDLARVRYQIQTERPLISFAAYRTWYYDHYSTQKRNATRERSMLRQLGKTFDRVQLHEIDRDRILGWRKQRATQVAPGTVNRELELLKHLLGTAVPKYLEKNLAAGGGTSGVARLRVPEQEVPILSPAQEARLLKVANAEERAVLLLALDTLQRLSNVANLACAQDHHTHITVLNPKVKGYKVPVSSRLRKALDAHARTLSKSEKFYFPSLRGATDAATRKKVIERFMALCAKAKIPTGRKQGGFSFHCLRHTGASRMLTRGVDVKTVAEIGGWTDIKVLQKYLHPTAAQQRAAVEVIGAR